MLLSIVVPVYNERHTLATVLGVVPRKEIIVVDDYSKDGTREWLKVNFPDRLLLSGTRLLALSHRRSSMGYDEPEILSYAITPFCPTSADGPHP